MKSHLLYIIAASASMLAVANPAKAATPGCDAPGQIDGVKAQNVSIHRVDNGANMHLTMDINLDDLKLGKDGSVTLRPALVNDTDTALFRSVTIYGRNQMLKLERNPQMRVPGTIEMRRNDNTPQTIAYDETVPYRQWMEQCQLRFFEDLCGCGRLKDSGAPLLTEIDYRKPGAPLVCYITPKAEAEKNRDESGQAFLDFIVNKTDIVPSYRNNRVELDKIIKTINLVKDDPFVTITNINIHGFASPEGDYANNTRLANGRAAALKDYVKSLYDLPDKVFTSNATPEDWEGLRRMTEASTIPDRQRLLDIIDSDMEYDAKDHEIRKQMPSTYAFILKEWYPALRHSDYKVSYVVRPLTIDEAKQVLKTNPKNLSLNEMFLVAQTYQPGSDDFNEVFEIAARVFPDDPTANLNAACTEINKGDLDRAAAYLSKAGNSPEAIHARGLLALKEGKYAEARKLLQEASDKGIKQADENIKILDRLEILKAEGF